MRSNGRISAAAAVVALVLSVPLMANALTSLDRPYGTPIEGESARSLAMGSVGVSDLQGTGALVQNPALLVGMAGRAHLDFQVGVSQANEDRFVPLYDTFDDLVAETAYVINRNTYASFQGGLSVRLPLDVPSVVAVGIFDRYDFDWDYTEELRDPSTSLGIDERDRLEQINEDNSDGHLRSFSFGYAAEILDGVHLGATAHRYFGEIDSRRREMPVDAANVEERLVRDLTGWGATFGVEVQAGSRLAFGASLEPAVTLKGDHKGSSDVAGTILPENGDYEVQYPLTWALGATFHPRNELRTTFSAEARFRNWDGLEDGYADALVDAVLLDDPDALVQTLPLRDTWDIRMGVEHVFYNGMPIRFGLRYLENATDRDSERTIFSAGTGWQAGEVMIDFTFQYHRQTSRQEFVFDEGAAGISNPTLTPKVEDSVLRGILGVRRSF